MDSYPIDFPAADAPGTPDTVTARLLGIHPHAVALLTLGWPAAPRAYHRETSTPGGMDVTWFIGQHPSRPDRTLRGAAFMVEQLHLTDDRALPADHPLRAALVALGNLAVLRQWCQHGGPVPVVYAGPGPFLTLRGEGPPLLWHQGEPVSAVADLEFIAAAITVGFIPWPQVIQSAGVTAIGFPADSITFPGLTFADLLRVAQVSPQSLEPRTLPGAAAEEHPWFYAFHAVRNVAPLVGRQRDAARNPILERQNPYIEQRRALVTNSLLEGTDALSRRVKAALHKHLKATIA